jgi:hypothetical protein
VSDPTSGIRRAITSLGQIEDKLRRALNLAGEVQLQFSPDMTPILIAGDASAPGSATYRGRRFSGGSNFSHAGAGSVGFKAGDVVVITSLQFMNSTAGVVLTTRLADSSIADPYAITTADIPFTERPSAGGDVAPITRSVYPSAASAIGSIVSVRLSGSSNTLVEQLPCPIVLEAGDKLIHNAAGLTGLSALTIAGYVF